VNDMDAEKWRGMHIIPSTCDLNIFDILMFHVFIMISYILLGVPTLDSLLDGPVLF
jgi:hypothetical protein